MAKNIWIRARISGCTFAGGKQEMNVICGNFQAIGEAVYALPVNLKDLPSCACFIKGMLNSSQNALVRTFDSWGPLGRLSTRFDYKNGVSVYHITNNFSRDGDLECVTSRDDAEKLCLLSQRFPCCDLDLAQIAVANGLDLDRLSARGLKTLELAVQNKLRHFALDKDALQMDDRVRAMVIAGV